MKIRGIIAIILVLSMILVSTGCSNSGLGVENGKNDKQSENNTLEDKPVYGGKLIVPISNVDSLNPFLVKDKSLYYFSKLIYEGLFEFNKQLDIENVLAEDYKITDNGQTIKVKLRDNVYWHDGEKFDASDVKFTIELMKYGTQNSPYRDILTNVYKPAHPNDIEHILNVKIIDDQNIEIYFDRSYSNALESLIFPILPEHQFIKDGSSNNFSFEMVFTTEEFKPIGTGPYKFKEYEKLKHIEIIANENWWKGKPYIDTIVGKILSDDEIAITSFESGQLDLAMTNDVDWEKYTERDNVRIYEFVSQIYEFIGFNFKNPIFDGEKGKALRKAIAYGLDRQQIIEKVYMGHGTESDLPISPGSWLISDEIEVYGYNVKKAKEILKAAGWDDKNGDGIYEDDQGNKLTLRLLTNSYNKFRKQTADAIIKNLKEIGIEVIPVYDTSIKEEITQEMLDSQWEEVSQKIASGDYDMVLTGWELSYIPDLSFAFHSSEIENGTNFISYNNPKMDELLVRTFRAPSREEKKNAYKELEKLIIDDLPYVGLFFRNSSILTDKKIKGKVEPQSFNIFYNIENWYIPEEHQGNNQENNQS